VIYILVYVTLIGSIMSTTVGCKTQSARANSSESIALELIKMEQSDQRLEQLVVNNDPQISETSFFKDKETAQIKNARRCREIFAQVGYPTNSLYGGQAARAFWLLVQHADSDPAFQEQVVLAMKPVVLQGEADADDLAMLTDRVRINTNRPQVYGSQVTYDMRLCKAMPKLLEHPQSVDQRRSEVGLAPLWVYMNEMSELTFSMNQDTFKELGITQPWVYPDGFTDW
jgi:uncharacterized protein DUF6624